MNVLKRAFINKVVDDLTILNGTEFEYFCKPLFELLVGEPAIHKGSNLYAKPISRTVDFSKNNFEIVGQCGTDNDYFDSFEKKFEDLLKLKLENTKPIKDIYSTLKNSDQCSKIILFANQEAKAGRLSNINKVINHLGINKDVEVVDSEGIATMLAENIGNQRLVLDLLDYLPSASQIYSAIAIQNALPPISTDIVRRVDESKILEKLQSNIVTVIHGVSGIGKSKSALSISHQLTSEFDSVIWVNYSERTKLDFQSVKVGEFDKNLNLANLCKTYKTLVVLDNFSGDAIEVEKEFKSFASQESRLLITSLERCSSKENCFHLSEMINDEAREIICQRVSLSENQIDQIITNVGGHPLCIGLICQIIIDEEYDDEEINEFISEIEQIPDEIVQGKSQTISDLVIGKYRDKFKNEFALISLLKTEQVSNYIFNRTLGRKAIRNLDKSSLIVRSSLNHSSIHSIVLLSICNLKPEASLIEEAKSNICEVLLEENEFKSFGYYNFCVLHHSFLKELYAENIKEKYRKALLYAIIQTTDNLVFKEGLVREVDKFDLADSTLENLLLLIEKIELKLISIDRKLDEDEYQKESQKAIDLLNIKKDSVAEGSNTRLLVEHHIAKIYFWKGDTDTSKNIFEELLSKYPDSDQCKLQLARIADNDKNYPEAERYVNEVLGGISKNKSLSIVLSFYDLISNSKYKESREKFIENRIEDFVSDISITLRSSFDHPYRVLSSLSSYLGFNIPEVFEELCSSLPVPDNASKNKKLMVAYADIQLALFRLYKYGNYPNKEHKLNATKLLAENYYIESQPSNDFENLKVAKFYIEIDKAEEAGLFLDKVVRKDPFYYQARAKQYRAVDHDKSLEAINSAIEGLERGECAKWFLSTFLNDKAETLKDRNNQEALKILELAIQKQSNRKTKDSWARKLNDWKSC